ncbi:MAG: alcohol dehydrogenase catalytic domain-containing protein [Xanthobacteraceae bacterium]
MCGSDLKPYRAAGGSAALGLGTVAGPVIAGHEPCGVVVAVGAAVEERTARVGARLGDRLFRRRRRRRYHRRQPRHAAQTAYHRRLLDFFDHGPGGLRTLCRRSQDRRRPPVHRTLAARTSRRGLPTIRPTDERQRRVFDRLKAGQYVKGSPKRRRRAGAGHRWCQET